MIKLKENIISSVSEMNINELTILYEQIRYMKRSKGLTSTKRKQVLSIDQILQMTSSSKSKWSDAVIEEREDRV